MILFGGVNGWLNTLAQVLDEIPRNFMLSCTLLCTTRCEQQFWVEQLFLMAIHLSSVTG